VSFLLTNLAISSQLLEKHSSTQASSLTDLQSELKSLKSLLIARRPTPSSPSSSSPSLSSATSITAPFGGAPRTPSLPAWQRKGVDAASLANPSSSGGYNVPSTASSSSTVQPEDPSASGVLVEKPEAESSEKSEEKTEGNEEEK